VLNDTLVTLEGWLGSQVSVRQAGAASVASFRLAATPRRFNPATGQWADDRTQWFTVNAWRALGEGCAASLRRGDPVVVVGRLRTTSWTSAEGVEMTGLEVDAQAVGHDLNRGSTVFTRAARAAGGPAVPAEVAHAPAAEPGVGEAERAA
jgi:single-strand DNA-binding protein